MSWSRDFIWTIAIRKDLAPDSAVLPASGLCPFNGISSAPDPANNKKTVTYRDIFIAGRPPKPHPIVRMEHPWPLDKRTRRPTFCERLVGQSETDPAPRRN